jgi:hypothetical protein
VYLRQNNTRGYNLKLNLAIVQFYVTNLLHNEELHNLYSCPDIIRQGKASQVKANEMGGECGTHGRGEKSVQGFGGKARGKETTWKTKA